MSAKDAAEAILRDFRTSMADTAMYIFDSVESARAVLDVMEHPDWLMAEQHSFMLTLAMTNTDERKLSV